MEYSAPRLLFATTEILLSKNKMTYILIPPKYTKEIQKFFPPLNPYNFDEKILKIEDMFHLKIKIYDLLEQMKNTMS